MPKRKLSIHGLCGIQRHSDKEWFILSKSNVTLVHNNGKNCKAIINYKSTKSVVLLNHLSDLSRIVKNIEAVEDIKREFFIG